IALAGGYASCRLAAHERAIRKGRTPDFTACVARLAAKYDRVERKLGSACPTLGDVGVVQAAARSFSDELADTAQGRLHCSEDLSRLELDVPASHPVPASAEEIAPGVLKLADGVYMAPGFGNTFLVT